MRPDRDSDLKNIEDRLINIENIRKRELSFFGLVFIIVLTFSTNLWSQYVYNSFIRNHGMGSSDNASLILLLVFTIITIGIILLFVLDVEKSNKTNKPNKPN